jgi:hypothetical protein
MTRGSCQRPAAASSITTDRGMTYVVDTYIKVFYFPSMVNNYLMLRNLPSVRPAHNRPLCSLQQGSLGMDWRKAQEISEEPLYCVDCRSCDFFWRLRCLCFAAGGMIQQLISRQPCRLVDGCRNNWVVSFLLEGDEKARDLSLLLLSVFISTNKE